MRIIAGSHRGARIFAPKGTETRPTGDRVREAAFNLLGPGAAEGATVLDLFAGSGAMGLEALSRGAEHATFVESERDACRTINRNLDKLGLGGATVLCQDALTAPEPTPARAGATISCWSIRLPRFFPAKRADSTSPDPESMATCRDR
jgi:16S rRNA (guanine966-N2)-methyltransferase